MIAAVYSTVSDGRLPGSVHTSCEHLAGSPMTGSPSQWPGSNANPMRVCVVPGLRWWMDRARCRVEGDAGFFLRFADACFEYVFVFFEVAAGQAELAAGVDVPGPAQQQDLPGTAEDDVDVDDAGESVRRSALRVRSQGVLPGSR